MATGIKIADGYVEVRAKTDGLDKDVEAMGSESAPAATKAGSSLGKKIVGGLATAYAAAKVGDMISGAVDQQSVQANLAAKLTSAGKGAATKAGKAAGAVFAAGYGENLDEVNDAVAGIQNSIGDLSGFSTKQIEDMSTDALTLSSVYGVDVTDSTKVAGQMMKNGLAKNAKDAFDIMSKGYSEGLDTSGEFLDSLNEYADPLKQLGLNGPKALAAFKASLDAGNFSIDKAGDALNEFSTRATDGSTTTKQGFDMIGLNATKMGELISKGGKSGSDGLHKTIAALAAMKDPYKQNQAGAALFGSMWEDAGKKTILALDPAKLKMDDVKGATDKINSANTTAASKIEASKRKYEQFTNSLIQVGGPMGDIISQAQALGPEALTTGASFITAGASVGTMGKDIVSGASAFKDFSLVQKISTAAQWLWNAALDANPIGLVIIGIAALVAGLIWFFTQTTIGRQIFAGFIAFVTSAWTAFSAWFMAALSATGAWFNAVWKTMHDGAVAIVTAIVNFVLGYFRTMLAGYRAIGAALAAAWRALWSGLKSAASAVWSWLKSVWSSTINGLLSAWRSVGAALRSAFSSVWSGVKATFSALVGTFRGLISNFIALFAGIGKKVSDKTSGMFGGIASAFKSAINSVIGWWNGLSFGIPAMKVAGVQITPALTFNTPNLPKLAKGTNYFGGGQAIVGEKGPELVTMPAGSKVTTASKTADMMKAPQTVDNRQYIDLDIHEAEDPLGSAGRVASELRKWRRK